MFKLHRDTVFADFARSEAVTDLVAELIGPRLDCFLSQFIFKNPGAWGQPWHQDSFYFPFEPPRPITGVWLAVTEATLTNGCLHVLPGSHREPVHEHVPDARPGANYGYVEIVDHDMAASVPVLMDPGDLLLFDSHLMHRSTDNESDGHPGGDGVPLRRHRDAGAAAGTRQRLRIRSLGGGGGGGGGEGEGSTRWTSEELVRPLSGADWWNVAASGEVPAIKVTDGPAGARASASPAARRRCRSRAVPPSGRRGTSELVGRVGAALAEETLAKGAQVLLGPTVNLQRSPLGGPPLRVLRRGPGADGGAGGRLRRGVAGRRGPACVKHLVANDIEADRFEISSEPDERTLRRCRCCRSSGRCAAPAPGRPWPPTTGSTARGAASTPLAHHDPAGRVGLGRRRHLRLVRHPRASPAAIAGLDLEMPGPAFAWGEGAGRRRRARRRRPRSVPRGQAGAARAAGRPHGRFARRPLAAGGSA